MVELLTWLIIVPFGVASIAVTVYYIYYSIRHWDKLEDQQLEHALKQKRKRKWVDGGGG